MTGEEIKQRLSQVETTQLNQLDNALGTIHEILPEVYAESGFAILQHINTVELSERN